MNKQSISFKADEQKLTKTGGIEHYASNIVAYIEATFDLGTNWSGYDSVRAVWSNDYLTDISTVLDPDGKCIVPTEVLTDAGNVTVNLVGSIADGDTLTDRLTTYPCKAVVVDADAKVEGEETESITPSQFEQFVEIVHDEVEQVTGMTAEAETLPAGSDATASYNDGVLSLGIPRGDKGEQGEQGETGHTGEPAGFGNVTASVDNTVGTPSVVVHTSGPDTAKEFDFAFHNLKGDKGDTGDTGATGNGIASTVLNPDYTLTITFTDGTSYTTPSIRGAKGDTGDTGATGNGIQSTVLNADYTLTITFTDGTSYTTPSIRGEQGPVGPVSDVTVNGTSVVDQNGVAVITMPELVKTVQGNPIVLDDAWGEVKNLDVELLPVQDLNGYSKPWAAGAGNNIWDEEWEQHSTFIRTKNYIPVLPETSYYFLAPENFANGVFWYDADRQLISTQYPPKNTVQTSPSGAKYLKFAMASAYGTTYNHDIAINYPASVTAYSPYSNICPITGHDSVSVRDTGINQWDEEWEVGAYNTGNGAKLNSTTNIRCVNIIKVFPNTEYCVTRTNNVPVVILQYDSNGHFISSFNLSSNITFTTLANARYINFYTGVAYGTTYNNDISINYPSTDTAYHAYHGQSKTVALPRTVYGAGVGVTSGSGKEKQVAVDMGDLTWTNYKQGGFRALLSDAILNTTTTGDTNLLTTMYQTMSYQTTLTNGQASIANRYLYCVNDNYTTDATAFKQGMTGQTIVYTLATPTDLSTTPTSLTLYNGDNVVSSDSDITMDYVQDMAIVIRKIESQL